MNLIELQRIKLRLQAKLRSDLKFLYLAATRKIATMLFAHADRAPHAVASRSALFLKLVDLVSGPPMTRRSSLHVASVLVASPPKVESSKWCDRFAHSTLAPKQFAFLRRSHNDDPDYGPIVCESLAQVVAQATDANAPSRSVHAADEPVLITANVLCEFVQLTQDDLHELVMQANAPIIQTSAR